MASLAEKKRTKGLLEIAEDVLSFELNRRNSGDKILQL